MANYLSDKTGIEIDASLDLADSALPKSGGVVTGQLSVVMPDAAATSSGDFQVLGADDVDSGISITGTVASGGTISTRLWKDANNLAITGFSGLGPRINPETGGITLALPSASIAISSHTDTPSTTTHMNFINTNGLVGSIQTGNVSTSYITSSDPRLKDFAPAPTDAEINSKFDALFSSFKVFNWKADPQGDLVWGFSAWDIEDAGLDCASVGEGPRNLNLGDVYETIPAVTESRVVMDSDGNPTTQIEEVVVTEAIEKKVSPSGIDQGKMTSYLTPMVELQKRQIAALTARLDAAGL